MSGGLCEQLFAVGVDVCQQSALSQEDVLQRLQQNWSAIQAAVRSFRETLDPVIWLIGSILAVVPGSYAIYRWWYYRRSRLPFRLQEYLIETESGLRADARSLLHSVASWQSPASPLKTPVFVRPTLVRAMRTIGWPRRQTVQPLAGAIVDLNDALKDIREQLKRVDETRALHRREEATAILLKGAIASAQAMKVTNEVEANQLNRDALLHFSEAYDIDSTELDVLLYKAHQHRVLAEIQEAIDAYREVQRKAANGSANARLLFLARRHEGELLYRQYKDTGKRNRLEQARGVVAAGVEAIPHELIDGIDHAASYEVLAAVCSDLGQVDNPEIYSLRAESIYHRLEKDPKTRKEAIAGLERLKKFKSERMSKRAGLDASIAGDG